MTPRLGAQAPTEVIVPRPGRGDASGINVLKLSLELLSAATIKRQKYIIRDHQPGTRLACKTDTTKRKNIQYYIYLAI